MRDPVSSANPYVVLGLEAGASMAEVKRAYRRLAKSYHPDSAGEAAVPRFLAIHAAYEAIRTGRPMATPRRGTGAGGPAGAPEPWRADPERARAARERARRGSGTRGARPTAGGTAGATGAGGAANQRSRSGASSTSGAAGPGGAPGPAGASSRAGATGTSGSSAAGGASPRAGRRTARKATLGSTTYDDARDPNDATWSGASWYGPSTGEYWIVNPREYADPRKHGPEYQSRARRMAAAAARARPSGGSEPDLDPDLEPDFGGEPDAESGTEGDPASPRPAAGGAHAVPDAEPAAAAASADRPRRGQWGPPAAATPADRPTRDDGWGDAWPQDARTVRRAGAAFPGFSRDWLGAASDDPIRRLGIALVAWPPIGLAAASLIGDLTGCSVYAADCGGTEPLLPWLAQAGILGLLLLLPPFARLLAGGTIAVLFALVPITAFLVAVGGSGAPQAGFALTFFLALAWLAGVAWGALRQLRPGGARGAAP